LNRELLLSGGTLLSLFPSPTSWFSGSTGQLLVFDVWRQVDVVRAQLPDLITSAKWSPAGPFVICAQTLCLNTDENLVSCTLAHGTLLRFDRRQGMRRSINQYRSNFCPVERNTFYSCFVFDRTCTHINPMENSRSCWGTAMHLWKISISAPTKCNVLGSRHLLFDAFRIAECCDPFSDGIGEIEFFQDHFVASGMQEFFLIYQNIFSIVHVVGHFTKLSTMVSRTKMARAASCSRTWNVSYQFLQRTWR
jgi:hypothetical protein